MLINTRSYIHNTYFLNNLFIVKITLVVYSLMGKALEPTHKSGYCKLLRKGKCSSYSQLLYMAEKGSQAGVDKILNEKEKKKIFFSKDKIFPICHFGNFNY